MTTPWKTVSKTRRRTIRVVWSENYRQTAHGFWVPMGQDIFVPREYVQKDWGNGSVVEFHMEGKKRVVHSSLIDKSKQDKLVWELGQTKQRLSESEYNNGVLRRQCASMKKKMETLTQRLQHAIHEAKEQERRREERRREQQREKRRREQQRENRRREQQREQQREERRREQQREQQRERWREERREPSGIKWFKEQLFANLSEEWTQRADIPEKAFHLSYKRILRIYHPDKEGDCEVFKTLPELWLRFQRERS